MKLSLKTVLLSFLIFAAAGSGTAQLPSLSAAIDKIFTDGVAAYKAGNYDAAIEHYSAFLRSRPNDHHAWYNRGLAYFKKGEYPKAADDFSKAVSIDAKYVQAFTQRARTYNELAAGDLPRYSALAIADFSKAISLRPNGTNLYRERAEVYLRLPDNAKALADLNNAIRLDPKNAELFYLRGKIKFDRRKYTEADADLREAVRLDPRHIAARSLLQTNAARLPKTTAAVKSARTRRPSPIATALPKSRTTPRSSSTSAPKKQTAAVLTAAPRTITPTGNDIEDGKKYLASGEYDKAIAAFERAVARIPKPESAPVGPVSLFYATEAAKLNRYIAQAYLKKGRADMSMQKCVDLERSLFSGLMSAYGEIGKTKLTSSSLMEIAKSNIDSLIIKYDLLESGALSSVEIAEGCIDMHSNVALIDDPDFKRLTIGMMRGEMANSTAKMLGNVADLNFTLMEFCDGKATRLCGSASSKNEVAKYRERALALINKAIKVFPNLKTSYSMRAKIYRYTGQNELAAADEAKANEP